MQTTKSTGRMLKKLFGVVTAGAFAVTPLAGVIAPAQSAPLVLAQNNRDSDARTLEGVVTVDRQGRDFILRLNNGQRVPVRSSEREPIRLSTGDRVRVRGFFPRSQPNVFQADSIQILNNRNTNNTRTLTGRVTDVDSDQRFDMVVDGTTYNVTASSRLPRRLNRGDVVRVYGTVSNRNEIRNATVVIVNNNNGNNNNRNNNGYQTFTGHVTEMSSNQRFDIWANGRNHNVTLTSPLPRRLNRRDVVRVYGRPSGNNEITNATVTVLNNNGNNSNNNDMRTFTGRVTDIESDQHFDMVVSGTTYNVRSSSRLPRRLEEGDTVRVYGRRSGGNDITNASVVVLDNNGNNNNNSNNNDMRTFTGRVTDIESDQHFDMVVNGTTYTVHSTTRLPRRLNRGDMVRVYGRRSTGNDITNASVVVLDQQDDDHDH